jgi:hypothetical protein
MLLRFFVYGVLIAMTTELLDFHPSWGVAFILLGSVTGNARSALSRVGATFRTFQGDDDPCAWLCHNLERPYNFQRSLL